MARPAMIANGFRPRCHAIPVVAHDPSTAYDPLCNMHSTALIGRVALLPLQVPKKNGLARDLAIELHRSNNLDLHILMPMPMTVTT